MSNSLFISPHDDDNVLFGAFTCLREYPLVVVVTNAYNQTLRGEVGCDVVTRAAESLEACKILGCPLVRLGLPDNDLQSLRLMVELVSFQNFDKVYIPALQGGNPQHDLIHTVAKLVFGEKCIEYTTYAPGQLYTTGNIEVIPTPEELDLKNQALACFVSQINLPATAPHFAAVLGKSEWLL